MTCRRNSSRGGVKEQVCLLQVAPLQCQLAVAHEPASPARPPLSVDPQLPSAKARAAAVQASLMLRPPTSWY